MLEEMESEAYFKKAIPILQVVGIILAAYLIFSITQNWIRFGKSGNSKDTLLVGAVALYFILTQAWILFYGRLWVPWAAISLIGMVGGLYLTLISSVIILFSLGPSLQFQLPFWTALFPEILSLCLSVWFMLHQLAQLLRLLQRQ